MVYTKEKIKCPICMHMLKYLYERTHVMKKSKKGTMYKVHKYIPHALWCKKCEVVYPLDLQQKVDDLTELI